MKFRKKPVVIEAVQFHGSKESANAIWKWMGRATVNHDGGDLLIETLEGVMRANPSDWIIKGVKGEFYPCKPDIFAATYEPAE